MTQMTPNKAFVETPGCNEITEIFRIVACQHRPVMGDFHV